MTRLTWQKCAVWHSVRRCVQNAKFFGSASFVDHSARQSDTSAPVRKRSRKSAGSADRL